MSDSVIRTLLMEDNPGDARLVRAYVADEQDIHVEITHVDRLAEGLELLAGTPMDVVLLDLNLPDNTGLGTLRQVLDHSPAIPVVVLTGVDTMEQALQAVREGAADYLIKSQINGPLLVRAIRFAVERAARRQAAAKTKDAEIRYRTLFEQSPDGIAVYDLETCLPTEFNSTVCDQLGYSQEEFAQLRMCDCFDGQIGKSAKDAPVCAGQLLAEEVHRREFVYRTKSDQTRHIVVLARPVTLSGQRRLYCIFRDTTERKQAELALKESQQQFRALVETTTDWIWATDAAGVYTYCSPRVRDVLGYEPEDVLGKIRYDFMLPSEALRVRGLVEKNRAAGSSLVRLEHVNLHKNGTHVVLETNAAPVFDHRGTLSGYRGIDRDVTQIKQAYDLLQERERRYQQLFAAVTSYAYSVKVDNGMSIATIHGEGCVSVTGYRPQDYQSIPDLWHLMIHPDDRDMVLRHVASVLGGQQVPPMEHRIFRRDGSIAWVRNTMIPHCNNGRLTRYDGLIEDITERKKAEEALREKELELLAAQKIQEGLLPVSPPLLPGVDVFGAVYPAEFTAGDYFDYLTLPDGRVGFTIGDVTGHGFGPALIMASIHVMFRLLVETHQDVGEILELANSVLVNETQEDRFVTLVFACFDLETKTLVYSNAGHPAGYVLNAAGDVRARLVSMNLPLGVAPNAKFCTGDPVTLEPGDTVLLLSDGILESKSPEGVLFGPKRTLDVVRANLHKTAAEIVENLCQTARGFSGDKAAFDDITAVVIKIESTH